MSNQSPENQDVNVDSAGNAGRQLQRRITTVLNLPETVTVKVAERESPGNQPSSIETKISICVGENHSHEYVIAKPLAVITDEDIKSLRAELHVQRLQ